MAAKVMLVTGGSRGIGAAVCRAAARAGYRVGVNFHRSAAAAQAVVAAIEREGGQAVALRADVGDEADVERLFAALDASLGTIDVLVNNAGVLASVRIEDIDGATLDSVFRANVYSAFHCTRQAVRRMSTAHGGRGGAIVNLSSVAARLGGLAGGSAYAASKAAIDTFTLAAAKELGKEGIRINALRPGLIATEIHDVHGGLEQMERLAASAVPLGRSGAAAEVAEAVLWLASDAASYVHGAVIDVAGGR